MTQLTIFRIVIVQAFPLVIYFLPSFFLSFFLSILLTFYLSIYLSFYLYIILSFFVHIDLSIYMNAILWKKYTAQECTISINIFIHRCIFNLQISLLLSNFIFFFLSLSYFPSLPLLLLLQDKKELYKLIGFNNTVTTSVLSKVCIVTYVLYLYYKTLHRTIAEIKRLTILSYLFTYCIPLLANYVFFIIRK